jgi:hypothetical protein
MCGINVPWHTCDEYSVLTLKLGMTPQCMPHASNVRSPWAEPAWWRGCCLRGGGLDAVRTMTQALGIHGSCADNV